MKKVLGQRNKGAPERDVLWGSSNIPIELYLDVLSYIVDDVVEIAATAKRTKSSNHIIVRSPAHQLPYSPFAHAISHQGHYDHASLLGCPPPRAQLVLVSYLDSICNLL